MAELPNVAANALAKAGCNINSITMSCVVNETTGTISLTTDENHTSSSLSHCFSAITLAVNRHLKIEENGYTEFQLTPSTVHIALDMVPLIDLPSDPKSLLEIIREQVHHTRKVMVHQAQYLVPDAAKRCWNENLTAKRFCTVIISIPTTDATRLGTTIKLFSRNVRARRVVPSNSATQCKNHMEYGHHTNMCKAKKPGCSICSKEHSTGEHRCSNTACEGIKNFKRDCCQMQKSVYKCYHCALDHITTHQDCPVRKAKNLTLREANKARHQRKLEEANINI
jgi:hypothetical protein